MFDGLLKFFLLFNFLFVVPDVTDPTDQIEFVEEGNYLMDDKIISYGYEIETATGDMNAVFFIKDKDSERVIYKNEFDDYGRERYVYLAEVAHQHFIMACEEYSYSNHDNGDDFEKVLLMEFNSQGQPVANTMLFEKPDAYFNIDYHLLVRKADHDDCYGYGLRSDEDTFLKAEYTGVFECQYQGQLNLNSSAQNLIRITRPGNYQLDIEDVYGTYNLNITLNPDIYFDGSISASGYESDLKIYSLGTLLLNGETYASGDNISVPGNYRLEVIGENDYHKTVDFEIAPKIIQYYLDSQDKLTDQESFDHPIAIYTNATSALLNDEAYTTKYIDEPGSYVLKLYGINDFSQTIRFSIIPTASGVENGGIYDEVSFDVFGEATLNGEKIENHMSLSEPGDYSLKLYFDNDVFKEYDFQIVSGEVEKTDPKSSPDLGFLKYIFFGFLGGGFFLISRKK